MEAPEEKFFIVNDWERGDGAFRDAADGSPMPMDRVRAIKRRGIVGDYTPLATWRDNETLLARRVIEAGQVLFLSTLPKLDPCHVSAGLINPGLRNPELRCKTNLGVNNCLFPPRKN